MELIWESLVVGIILLIVSIPIMDLTNRIQYDGKEKFYVSTVLIGIITHLIFEYSGANKWRRHGHACRFSCATAESIYNPNTTHPASL